MAYVSDTVIVELQAKLDEYNRSVLRASETFEKGMDKIGKSALRAEAQALRSSTAIQRAFSAIGGALLVREVQQMADAWTDYSARVGLAIRSMDAAPAVMERLYNLAQQTYSSFEQTAESFVQNSNTLRELGYSTQEQLNYTEALNNAFVVSGARAERAASLQNALSKAMAAGRLQGDNLNTVIETGGRVAEALAAELGVTTLQLRDLGSEGKITGDVIYNALTNRMEELAAEAAAMPATISDGFQQMRNALMRFIGTMDQASGVSGMIAESLVYLASNFDSVAYAAGAAGALLLSTYAPALARVAVAQAAVVATNPFLLMVSAISAATYALSAFGDQIIPIEGDLANLQDYASAAWGAIQDGIATVSSVIQEQMLSAINLITQALSGVEVSWEDVWQVVKGVINAIIGAITLLYNHVVISFTKLPSAVAEVVVNAMNYMVEKVEQGINKVIEAVNGAIRGLNMLGEWAGVELIGELDPVALGRIENRFAGAGQAVGDAYGQALEDAAQDHLANIGEAWRAEAERIAAERAAAEAAAVDPIEALGGGGGGGGAGAGAGSGGGRGGRGGKNRKDELQREIEQIKERTASLQAQTEAQSQVNPLIEDYGYALAKAEATQNLLNAAQAAGIEITPELAANIEQLAEAYAQATVASNQLKEAQDNARRSAEEMKSLGKSVMSGFINDLKSGKSAADALANALDKIADKLLDMALDNFFSGGGGGFGGILKGIFSIFGFAKGGIAKNGKPMKTFAKGGISREAAIFGEGPQPEAAVPLPDGRRIPVDLRMPENGGVGAGETIRVVLEDDSGRMAEIADQRIRLASGPMLEVSVTQSANTSRKGLPGASSYYQKRGTI